MKSSIACRSAAVLLKHYWISESDRGRGSWVGKVDEQRATYGNRRRICSVHGKAMFRQRAEFVERNFAHIYDTGKMRRCWLRGAKNILKRLLVFVAAFNLGLLLRKLTGYGMPRGLAGRNRASLSACILVLRSILTFWSAILVRTFPKNKRRRIFSVKPA